MKKKLTIIILIISVVASIWFVFPLFFVKAAPDSLIQLIATPMKFHNKPVRVSGFLVIEFEGNALYLHQEDADFGISANSVWVDLSDEMKNNPEKYNNKHVCIEGTFNAKSYGHMWHFSGVLDQIKTCYLLEK